MSLDDRKLEVLRAGRLKHLLCRLKPQLLPLLLFHPQGPIQLSKHTTMASLSQ